MELVVVAPFGERQVGERIRDAEQIEAVLAEHADKVVRVAPEPVKE